VQEGEWIWTTQVTFLKARQMMVRLKKSVVMKIPALSLTRLPPKE